MIEATNNLWCDTDRGSQHMLCYYFIYFEYVVTLSNPNLRFYSLALIL